MSKSRHDKPSHSVSLELFQPDPNSIYELDDAARIAGTSRRILLGYCRLGFVRPLYLAPYDVMAFTEEALHTVRTMEHLRITHGMNVACLKAVNDLMDEVVRLKAEVRFLRSK